MTRARETARAAYLAEKTFPLGKDVLFRINGQTLSQNVTISSTENAVAAGPISVDSDVTLTLQGNLSIV